jgi:hypothetical protein
MKHELAGKISKLSKLKQEGDAMKKHELAEKISHLVTSVLDDGPVDRSRSFLPMTSRTSILPRTTFVVRGRTQVWFRGDRLAAWSRTAAQFFIRDVRVGNFVLSAQSGDVPADAFATRMDLLPVLDEHLSQHGVVTIRVSRRAEECIGQPLAFPLAAPSMDFSIEVENVSDEPAIFAAAILGDVECRPASRVAP